jgi:biopolymer transport protein TolQ
MFASNPIIASYNESDLFGKVIFWSLYLASLGVWFLILHKGWLLIQTHKLCREFERHFPHKAPLSFQTNSKLQNTLHPQFTIYKKFKQVVFELQETPITKDYAFTTEWIEGALIVTITQEIRKFEVGLSFLSVVVPLSPFLGLLGTVWGILITFATLHKQTAFASQTMLSGLSLALATTIVGLLVAIPALIGYTVLKTSIKNLESKLYDFAHQLTAAYTLYYTSHEKTPAAETTLSTVS